GPSGRVATNSAGSGTPVSQPQKQPAARTRSGGVVTVPEPLGDAARLEAVDLAGRLAGGRAGLHDDEGAHRRAERPEVADELPPGLVPREEHRHARAERVLALEHRVVERAEGLVAADADARQHLEQP